MVEGDKFFGIVDGGKGKGGLFQVEYSGVINGELVIDKSYGVDVIFQAIGWFIVEVNGFGMDYGGFFFLVLNVINNDGVVCFGVYFYYLVILQN